MYFFVLGPTAKTHPETMWLWERGRQRSEKRNPARLEETKITTSLSQNEPIGVPRFIDISRSIERFLNTVAHTDFLSLIVNQNLYFYSS